MSKRSLVINTAWFLGETLDAWKLGVFAAVIVGLGVNQFGAQAPKTQG